MTQLVSKELPREVEAISHTIIGCAVEVHRVLGPGLLESLYEEALAHELAIAGLSARRQVEVDVEYKGIVLRGQRLDLVVEGRVVVELKAINQLAEIHAAQLLSYLRAANMPLGLLFNFNTLRVTESMRRIFNHRAIKNTSGERHDVSHVRSNTPSCD